MHFAGTSVVRGGETHRRDGFHYVAGDVDPIEDEVVTAVGRAEVRTSPIHLSVHGMDVRLRYASRQRRVDANEMHVEVNIDIVPTPRLFEGVCCIVVHGENTVH